MLTQPQNKNQKETLLSLSVSGPRQAGSQVSSTSPDPNFHTVSEKEGYRRPGSLMLVLILSAKTKERN